ncbi:SIS domain-containing protein [Streptomyces sp. NBC_01799]|uniref:SIS domain-containing protein n=1 Tax=Streptomyces sp. NBC_01800 TaxID=2975945 RepID=UPI002DDBB41B|nr:SIS domain-containing protein [Streptomyces sp. NBC_01800]WSA73301.1 SIS domain-containing protein [Streptomyces sp. NBC_01800]WSA81825.1 SIS domain-containing protein [Streptomyces sp. NBC_01799]
MAEPQISATLFADRARASLDGAIDANAAAVAAAARLFADCVAADGVIHAFGTGHSQATALEIAGRAGGLIPTNRMSLADLVLRGGEERAVLDDPLLERRPGLAARLYELSTPRPQDLFVIISNSGVNNSIVDLAQLVTGKGHLLVALTSLEHTRSVPALHPSGQRLADLADVVLDNCAPAGDALLPLPGGGTLCGVSTIVSATLVQMVLAESVALLMAGGHEVPVYISANLPGGFERNAKLEAHYEGRLHRNGH